MNNYCMFKGSLVNAAPFLARYGGKPHYVITVAAPGRETFKIVVNAASDQTGVDGNHDVYSYVDLHFVDPVTDKLAGMKPGLYQKDFPRLDYFQDRSLLDLHRMRPIPYADVDGNRADVNDILNDALSIDASGQPESLPYDDGSGNPKDRDFYLPKANDVAATVYGFGFLFPQEDGLHETHMNQGNPKNGGHWRENGTFQDGAVIVQKTSGFAAIFTAFQTQHLPTDSKGFPVDGALALPDFIRGSN